MYLCIEKRETKTVEQGKMECIFTKFNLCCIPDKFEFSMSQTLFQVGHQTFKPEADSTRLQHEASFDVISKMWQPLSIEGFFCGTKNLLYICCMYYITCNTEYIIGLLYYIIECLRFSLSSSVTTDSFNTLNVWNNVPLWMVLKVTLC